MSEPIIYVSLLHLTGGNGKSALGSEWGASNRFCKWQSILLQDSELQETEVNFLELSFIDIYCEYLCSKMYRFFNTPQGMCDII